jgi:hypothetical protein
MHQNMNTFSDLQDTDLLLDFSLRIQPVGQPHLKVLVNSELVYSGLLQQALKIQRNLPLLELISIQVQLLEKDYNSSKETAVVIEELRIDNFELLPNWTHLVNYNNDHDYSAPTNYLGFVGTWELTTDAPFYQWLHRATGQGLLLNTN